MQSFYAARKHSITRTRKQRQWSHCEPSLTRDILICFCWIFHWMGCTDTNIVHASNSNDSCTDMFHTPPCVFSTHLTCPSAFDRFYCFFFHRKLVTCVIHGKTHRRKKAALASAKTFMWLSCHNRKHLEPVEQMLGEDLTEARGHKSDTVSSSQAPCYDNTTRQILLLTHL